MNIVINIKKNLTFILLFSIAAANINNVNAIGLKSIFSHKKQSVKSVFSKPSFLIPTICVGASFLILATIFRKKIADSFSNNNTKSLFKNNNIEKIKNFINDLKDINAKCCGNFTPLQLACINDNVEILDFLIKEKNAKIDNETARDEKVETSYDTWYTGDAYIQEKTNSIELAIKNKSFKVLDYFIKTLSTKTNNNEEIINLINKCLKNEKATNDNEYINSVIITEMYINKNVDLVKHFVDKKNFPISFDLIFSEMNFSKFENIFKIAKYCIKNNVFGVNDKILKENRCTINEKPKKNLMSHALLAKNQKLVEYLIQNGSEEPINENLIDCFYTEIHHYKSPEVLNLKKFAENQNLLKQKLSKNI